MSEILEKLEALQSEAMSALAQAGTTEETEAWYSQYLGRKGAITAIVRGVGKLSPEERPVVGKLLWKSGKMPSRWPRWSALSKPRA
jgi:phenylalanyl-tRNA synthetase alpha subunit